MLTGPTLTAVIIAMAAAVACGRAQVTPTPAAVAQTSTPTTGAQSMMGQMGGAQLAPTSVELAPLVRGFYSGGEVIFIHTEASDPDVAGMLTMMMGPQVVHVPRLADAPASITANVFVFKNGVPGPGPFGFQPDVFDSVPDDPGYAPLRRVSIVTWNEGATPSELRSAADVDAAAQRGEIRIERPGVVVNMPILVWPGGQR